MKALKFLSKYKIIILLTAVVLILGFVIGNNRYEKALSSIEAGNIKTYTLMYANEDRGSHYDGYTEYVFSDLKLSEIQKTVGSGAKWKKYSSESPINILLYGGERDGIYFSNIINFDLNISEGYYFFSDKQNSKTNYSEDDIAEIYSRASINFVLAIIDTYERQLYYFRYDT